MAAATHTMHDRPYRSNNNTLDDVAELVVDGGLELPDLARVPMVRSPGERPAAPETEVMTYARLAEACLRLNVSRHGYPVRGLDEFSPGTAG